MYRAASDARKATAAAISSGVPIRPSGMYLAPPARRSSWSPVSGRFYVAPGATAFTRMPYFARSTAIERVKASIAPLEAS